LRARLKGAEIVFFDGTTFEDDEMIRLGLSPKTAWRMGHMAMNGPKGSISELSGLNIERRIFIHINNSNPALLRDSSERARVEAAGWEISFDGMAIDTEAHA
jgi:pyrroloquinoline quinone biosynthesis protein B